MEIELPRLESARPVELLIALAALVMVVRLDWSVLRTLGACALLGLASAVVGLV